MTRTKAQTSDAIESVQESTEAPEKESKPGLLPIDYEGNYCPNCNDRLHHDYQNNRAVCPLSLENCPQHEV